MRVSFGLWLAIGFGQASALAQESSPTAAALRAIFNPQRAPQAKSMGLFQANFLDAVPAVPQPLQLAVVIDSTESMSQELTAIRDTLPAMFADLARIHDGQLATTLVTYSDVGASELPVRVLNRAFVSDPQQVATLLAEVRAESGRPYFPESVDLGVFTAVEQLEWSPDESVQKWVLVVGDAPPYDPEFSDAKTKARRWYDTRFLVDLASQKNIKVHCLLCPSRENEQTAYQESLAKSRQFMSQLSDGTGGRMLDLSYPLVRQELVSAARQPESKYARIGYVSESDLAALRPTSSNRNADDAAVPASLRVAVLPFMPWETMSFFHELPAVQLATELRQALKRVPTVQTVAPRQIEDELSRLKGEGLPLAEWPAALCWRLRADYLVAGELRSSAAGESFAGVQIFGREGNQPLVQLASQAPIEQLASTILRDLPQAQPLPQAIQTLAAALLDAKDGDATGDEATAQLAGLESEQRVRLLAALEALEQALGYALGDPQAESLLTAAQAQTTAFLQQQPEHAFAHTLQASAAYNLAKLQERRGNLQAATEQQQTMAASLKEAFRLRTQLVDRLLRLEVQADHALMVSHDPVEAAARYAEIVQFAEASPLRPALRAHWMLLAIHAGAWQIEATHPDLVQPEKVREHVLQILAFWPSSSEAAAVKRFLLWDEKTGRSRTPYLPVETQPLAVAGN